MDLIAQGGMSDVYRHSSNTILKLYHGGDRSYEADCEYMNSMAIYETGFPTPEPIERVEVDGRSGIVFRRLEGPTLMDMLLDSPKEVAYTTANIMAAFHKLPVRSKNHNCLSDMLRLYVKRAALLNDDERVQINRIVNTLPDGCAWVHGDFNPYNIMLHCGKPMLIDFVSLCVGNALFDVGYVVMMIRYAEPLKADSDMLKRLIPMRIEFEQAFVEEYTRLTLYDRYELEPWFVMAAVERLHPHNNVDLPKKQEYTAFIRESLARS